MPTSVRNPHARIDHHADTRPAGTVGLNADRQPVSTAKGLRNPFSRSYAPAIARKGKDR